MKFVMCIQFLQLLNTLFGGGDLILCAVASGHGYAGLLYAKGVCGALPWTMVSVLL